MSRFQKLTHAIRHCKYHIVWTPKYHFRVLEGDIKSEVQGCVRISCEQCSCKVVELNVPKRPCSPDSAGSSKNINI